MGKSNNPHPERNLTAPRWKKGQSGNPKGKPIGTISVSSALRAILDQETVLKENPITGEKNVRMKVSQRLALSILARSVSKGGDKAAELILDRTEGKLAQPLKHTGIPAAVPLISAEVTQALAGLSTEALEKLIAQEAAQKIQSDED